MGSVQVVVVVQAVASAWLMTADWISPGKIGEKGRVMLPRAARRTRQLLRAVLGW